MGPSVPSCSKASARTELGREEAGKADVLASWGMVRGSYLYLDARVLLMTPLPPVECLLKMHGIANYIRDWYNVMQ